MDPFQVLTRTVARYSYGFQFFLVVTRILPFLGTRIDWTLSRYSPEQLLDFRTDSTFSWYSLGFCLFSVLTLIGPFSGTHPNSFWILAQILLFPGTHPDSFVLRYSHWLDRFPVLTRTGFGYSHGFYILLVLTRFLPFFGSHIDWTLFPNSP